ncbi:hypothetical protein [Bdellovibrio sp. BCCA]|uniref:hypothetical protein n=1 Tax=Bdellovibrio sp. BCCA TaxID=3136281 RepID=UPI0030F231E4
MSARFDQRGNIVLSLILVGVLGIIVSAVAALINDQIKEAVRQRQSSQHRLALSSAIETFMVAVRFAEAKYMIETRHCDDARLFLRALAEGHHCSQLGGKKLTTFTVDDLSGLTLEERSLFTYGEDWEIQEASPAQGPMTRKVMSVSMDRMQVDFFYNNTFTSKDRAEFNAVLYNNGERIANNRFSLFTSDSPNRMHLDSGDLKIVQQYPTANDACRNQMWSKYRQYSGTSCDEVANLGGGTGVAFYRGDFFGLRANDGQIVNFRNLNGSSYLVAENGSLNGVKVFPEYNKEAFTNVDDIEILGEDAGEDQLIAVHGGGEGTVISYLNTTTKSLIPICKLGQMGWAQGFSGIAGTIGSHSLILDSSNPSASVSTFLLKSDSGKLLYVLIKSVATSEDLTGLEPEFLVTQTNGRKFICTGFPDTYEQDIENTRTLGLTRGKQVSRPYYIF